jgi:hypothetical protein
MTTSKPDAPADDRPVVTPDLVRQRQTMTEPEWQALGRSLFGDDLTGWRFRCPTCGSVMSIEKARAMPVDQLAKLLASKRSVEQECVGRHIDAGRDWCAYGLFSGPFFVVRGSGSKTPVFGFDVGTEGQHDPRGDHRE